MNNLLYQGNTYQLSIQLINENDEIITNEQVEVIEFSFGEDLKKNYALDSEDVIYDEATQSFIIRLSQADTFSFKNTISYQARIKYNDGSVNCTKQYSAYIYDAISKVVL